MIVWTPGRTLAEMEMDVIEAALKYFRGNKVQTASALGICTKTLNNKLSQYETIYPQTGNDVEPRPQISKEPSLPMRESKEVQEMPSQPPSEGDSKSSHHGRSGKKK